MRDNNNDDCDTMCVREELNDKKEYETRSMKNCDNMKLGDNDYIDCYSRVYNEKLV